MHYIYSFQFLNQLLPTIHCAYLTPEQLYVGGTSLGCGTGQGDASGEALNKYKVSVWGEA